MFRQSFDIDTQGLVLPDFVTLFGSFCDGDEKILNFFVVNLKHGHVNFVLFIGVLVVFDSIEYFFTGDGDNTLSYKNYTLLAP